MRRVYNRSFSIPIGDENLNMSEFTLALIEALNDKTVVEKLASANTSLTASVEELRSLVLSLKYTIKQRDEKIEVLESKVEALTDKVDDLEQYSRRNNIRITGITETPDKCVPAKVRHLVNNVLKCSPPLMDAEIDRCHRVGPTHDRQGTTRKRAILIKFVSYDTRARVMGMRRKLRNMAKGLPPALAGPWPTPTEVVDGAAPTTDGSTPAADDSTNEPDLSTQNYGDYAGKSVFFNEDLTAARSQLAWRARELKKQNKISDTWTHDGRILIKDRYNNVKPITSRSVLEALA